jgi:hypothetical protein
MKKGGGKAAVVSDGRGDGVETGFVLLYRRTAAP